MFRSVRLRLLALALLPLMVVMPILLGVTMVRWIDKFDDLLIAKVASDLRIAEEYFHRIETTQAEAVAAVAQSVGFAEELFRGGESLAAFLEARRQAAQLDFLVTFSSAGRADPALPESVRHLARMSAETGARAGLVLFSNVELAQLGDELAHRASIPLVETQAARPLARTVETRGMVLLAVYEDPRSGMILVGGRLLNQNLSVIDTMNDLIYRDLAAGADQRAGTTTLFLDDVRISTNVRLFEGERALGTRVSEVVWQQVMVEGRPWLDRAFVVNDWYISGYVPLTDISGERIGMLYTGFLEAPFSEQRSSTVLTLVLAFLAVVCVSVPIFLKLAQGVFSPLEKMTAVMNRVGLGELNARLGKVKRRDEIGQVANHLDHLLDQVQERDERLRSYANDLNGQVEKRTVELREANQQLEATYQQLIVSEKLASIGEITAGVAHEINNPVAVIQGNLEVIRNGMGSDAQDYKIEFDLIDGQTHRINTIVRKLLNFSRSDEASEFPVQTDVQSLVDDTAILVAADLRNDAIDLEINHHAATPDILVIPTELQQVLVNLLINAAQAIGSDGKIAVETKPSQHNGQNGALIRVCDTGPGIASEKLAYVFDPFFTTKLGEGTGLGLSISQSLVKRAGGHISAHSALGEGAVFEVWFPGVDISSQSDNDSHMQVDIMSS
ncbi:MAG: cache domain-containing protein [Pseudomonadota bacterium]